MSIEDGKVLGEIGALLILVCPLAGTFAAILGLVGFVLLIAAFDGLADHYRDRSIFNNALHGGIAFIAGAVVATIMVVIAAIGMLTVLGIPESGWFDPAQWQAIEWDSFTNWSAMAPYIAAMVGALAVLFALSVYAAILMRRSLGALAQRSGVAMFATCGTFLLVGAALVIVGVGLILLWIALVLLAVAFFRLRIEHPRMPMASV